MTIAAKIEKIDLARDGRPIAANDMLPEQQTALLDLIHSNQFAPAGLEQNGPYHLALYLNEGRLVFEIKDAQDNALNTLVLSLKPYRRLIEDYFLMIRSYEAARKEGRLEKLETIDMARRGLHNEGATLLQERLSGKIEMDFDTARRFFTLICVLHEKHLRLAR